MTIKKIDFSQFEQLSIGMGDMTETGESGRDEAVRAETARRAFEGNGLSGASWYEQYLSLKESGFKWRVAAYIAWASAPKIGRWPKTQDELATTILGLSTDRVIGTWRRKNPAIDELVSDLQAAPMLAARADVFRALIESATDPSHQGHRDRKLLLELTGDYTPRQRVELETGSSGLDLSQMSEEELTRIAKRMVERADGLIQVGQTEKAEAQNEEKPDFMGWVEGHDANTADD